MSPSPPDPVGNVYAIVLAAGLGSRFGGCKMLAPWRDGVLLDGAVARALASPVDGVIVVTGSQADGVAAAALARANALGASARLRTVHAENFAAGMAASLRAGFAALPADARAAFVFLGDMPLVPAVVPQALLDAMDGAGALAAVPVHDGRRGHPVLFSCALFAGIQALTGDAGARAVLDGLGDRLLRLPCDDPGVLFDVDRREQLAG